MITTILITYFKFWFAMTPGLRAPAALFRWLWVMAGCLCLRLTARIVSNKVCARFFSGVYSSTFLNHFALDGVLDILVFKFPNVLTELRIVLAMH